MIRDSYCLNRSDPNFSAADIEFICGTMDPITGNVRIMPEFHTITERVDPNTAVAIATSKGELLAAWFVPTGSEDDERGRPLLRFPVCQLLDTSGLRDGDNLRINIALFQTSVPYDMKHRKDSFCISDLSLLGDRLGDWRQATIRIAPSSRDSEQVSRSLQDQVSPKLAGASVIFASRSPYEKSALIRIHLIIDEANGNWLWDNVPIARVEVLDKQGEAIVSHVFVKSLRWPPLWNQWIAFTVPSETLDKAADLGDKISVRIVCDEQMLESDPYGRHGWVGTTEAPAKLTIPR